MKLPEINLDERILEKLQKFCIAERFYEEKIEHSQIIVAYDENNNPEIKESYLRTIKFNYSDAVEALVNMYHTEQMLKLWKKNQS
jgi:hypothetical protein